MTHRLATLIVVAAAASGISVTACAQTSTKSATTSVAAPSSKTSYWYDGKTRRQIYYCDGRSADFGVGGKRSTNADDVIVASTSVAGKPPQAGISPVYQDGSSGGQQRALPGGVIVTLKATGTTPMTPDVASATLQQLGLTPVRSLGANALVWLVASDPGDASLALANTLFESGKVESAQPNWWQPRALK